MAIRVIKKVMFGGIGISLPLTHYLKMERRSIILIALSHIVFLILGLAGAFVIYKKARS